MEGGNILEYKIIMGGVRYTLEQAKATTEPWKYKAGQNILIIYLQLLCV